MNALSYIIFRTVGLGGLLFSQILFLQCVWVVAATILSPKQNIVLSYARLIFGWLSFVALFPVSFVLTKENMDGENILSYSLIATITATIVYLFLVYRSHVWNLDISPWTTSLMHGISTAFFATVACLTRLYIQAQGDEHLILRITEETTLWQSLLLENAPTTVTTTLPVCVYILPTVFEYLCVVNLFAYMASDIWNPNKAIYTFHHIMTMCACIAVLTGYIPTSLVAPLTLAEWTVPWLFCAKKKIFVPYSYVGLMCSHIVFRIAIPWFWIRPLAITYINSLSTQQETTSTTTNAFIYIFWGLWYIYNGLQAWWLLTMMWLAYRMITTKRSPDEIEEHCKDPLNYTPRDKATDVVIGIVETHQKAE